MSKASARLIAFYLPQYHPIPENDAWWGKGFTEWTNVAKAKPLFSGHCQPHLPADLGFYDLRVPETRIAQAEMARSYGIEGFCYWHYWFGNGRRLLERPVDEVLKSGEPNFPFCLAWANASWTGIWYGEPNRILIEQAYPGMNDYERHFYTVLDAFRDSRYIHIDGKPVFMVFRAGELPDPGLFTDYWRELAIKAGLKGIYFIALQTQFWDPRLNGFDAAAPITLQPAFDAVFNPADGVLGRMVRRITGKDLNFLLQKIRNRPKVYPYAKAVQNALVSLSNEYMEFPIVMPNWDNTPRSGRDGIVFNGSTPELFRKHLRDAINLVSERDYDKRVIIVKSWNEWAEGNYLEPDRQFGHGYLEVIRDEIC